LDQIITQMMENSNASRPVAAPEEVISKLPRAVLEEGCKSACAVFQVNC
jgi:E3 ubiquitin-protein ligase RNF115/126